MAFTAYRTWTTGELVTAAMFNQQIRDNGNFLGGVASAGASNNINGFTNVTFADLDALTTASGAAVAVTVDTRTTAIVIVSARIITNTTANQQTLLGYRVSGASTIAADSLKAAQGGDDTSLDGAVSTTYVHFENGLSAGTNTFELQAAVTANAGRLDDVTLAVIPLIT